MDVSPDHSFTFQCRPLKKLLLVTWIRLSMLSRIRSQCRCFESWCQAYIYTRQNLPKSSHLSYVNVIPKHNCQSMDDTVCTGWHYYRPSWHTVDLQHLTKLIVPQKKKRNISSGISMVDWTKCSLSPIVCLILNCNSSPAWSKQASLDGPQLGAS